MTGEDFFTATGGIKGCGHLLVKVMLRCVNYCLSEVWSNLLMRAVRTWLLVLMSIAHGSMLCAPLSMIEVLLLLGMLSRTGQLIGAWDRNACMCLGVLSVTLTMWGLLGVRVVLKADSTGTLVT